MAIGALESFAEIWPRGKVIVGQVKTVARELLCLGLHRPLGVVASPRGLAALTPEADSADATRGANKTSSRICQANDAPVPTAMVAWNPLLSDPLLLVEKPGTFTRQEPMEAWPAVSMDINDSLGFLGRALEI